MVKVQGQKSVSHSVLQAVEQLAQTPVISVYAGFDNGNSTLVLESAVEHENGDLEDSTLLKTQGWIYEHRGDLDSLQPVTDTASSQPSVTFKYISGNPGFVGRVFKCGRGAVQAHGVHEASQMGDDPTHKLTYGLPMHIFGLISQYDSYGTINASVVTGCHKKRLMSQLKASLNGNHSIEVLTKSPDGVLHSRPVHLNLAVTVVPEGYGALWNVSGAGLDGDHPVDFESTSLIFDLGAGSADALLFENGHLLKSTSLPVAGHEVLNALLDNQELLALFPAEIDVDRGMIESAILDGSWCYKKGTVSVDFSAIGKTVVKAFITVWKRRVFQVSQGHQIDQTVLVGGLFDMKCQNADGIKWSLAELFQAEFLAHDFVCPKNPQDLNAKGNYQLALS